MNIGLAALLVLAPPSGSIQDFARSYDLRAEVRQTTFTDQALGYTVSGTPVTAPAMRAYERLWKEEWSLYPPSLMRKLFVRRVVFCEGLRVNEQYRAAAPSFDLETMYYDPALGAGRGNYQRSVIHHEFFHMIDERMGILYVDPQWSALNPDGFSYGTGGANMRDGNVGALTDQIPGFLTIYGTSAVEEDKAELFAKLVIEPEFVAQRAKADPVLAAKVMLLKRRLADYHPGMGASFWKEAAKAHPVRARFARPGAEVLDAFVPCSWVRD